MKKNIRSIAILGLCLCSITGGITSCTNKKIQDTVSQNEQIEDIAEISSNNDESSLKDIKDSITNEDKLVYSYFNDLITKEGGEYNWNSKFNFSETETLSDEQISQLQKEIDRCITGAMNETSTHFNMPVDDINSSIKKIDTATMMEFNESGKNIFDSMQVTEDTEN